MNSEIMQRLSLENLLVKDNTKGNGPAEYYRIDGYEGRIGFISAVSTGFCKQCNRIRLTSTGFLKGCLCYDYGLNLKGVLWDETKLKAAIKAVVENKPVAHCFTDLSKITEKKEMNKIGG
jgi:cyclic pyranopterin phosphate synthase